MNENNNNPQEPQSPQEPQPSPQPQNFPPQQPWNNTVIPPQGQQTPPGQGMSIAALVCGILGIIGGFIPVVNYFTLLLAILGIVFGVKGRRQAEPAKTGLATAGLVLGIIGVCFSAIGVICAICVIIAGGAAASYANGWY